MGDNTLVKSIKFNGYTYPLTKITMFCGSDSDYIDTLLYHIHRNSDIVPSNWVEYKYHYSKYKAIAQAIMQLDQAVLSTQSMEFVETMVDLSPDGLSFIRVEADGTPKVFDLEMLKTAIECDLEIR